MPPQQPGFRTVRTPDGTEHRFPAEATDAQIAEALGAMTPSPSHETPPPAAPTSFLDSLVQQAKSYLQAYGAHEAHMGRFIMNKATEHPAATGATIAGIATAPFTGGMSLAPAMAFSGLMAGGGAAVGQLTSEAAGGPIPTPGQAAREIGTQAAFGAAGEAAGRGVSAGVQWVGRKISDKAANMMQSAVKPTLAMTKGKPEAASKIARTLLEEGVNVTPGGLEKMNALIEATNDEIKQAIQGSTATVDALAVAQRTTPVTQKFMNQVAPTSDVNAIRGVVDDFLSHPQMPGTGQIPVADAQALKTGTYRALAGKYGEVGSAATEAQKALARGLKEEIASAVPEIVALNAREGTLITAKDALERRVLMAANRDPAGLSWLAKHPLTFMMALMDRSPVVKSLVARGEWAVASRVAKVPADVIQMAMRAIAASGADAAMPGMDQTVPSHPGKRE